MGKFKVGDKVKLVSSVYGNKGKVGTITEVDDGSIPYKVEFDNGLIEWCYAYEFEPEEETSMKFKVGDKVKVSNSWDGHNGEVGEINEYNKGYEFEYCVKFDGEYEESFRETELELESEKDNYPTLKQEYRSLLEIQKELTTLEESMMSTVRHTRTEIARNNEALAELESKILDAAKQ